MKKLILKSVSLLLCLSLVLTLSACGTKGDSGSENDPPPVEEEVLTGTYAYDFGLCISDPKYYTGDVVNVNLVSYCNFSTLSDDGSFSEQYDSSGTKIIKIAANFENKEIIPASFLDSGISYGMEITYLSADDALLRIGGEEVTLNHTDKYTEQRFDFTLKEYTPVLETGKLIGTLYISKIKIYRPVTEQEPELNGDTATVSYKFADTENASEYGILIAADEKKNLTADDADGVKTFSEKNYSADIDLSGGAVTVRGFAKYADGRIAYSATSAYTKELLEKRGNYKEKTETYKLSDDSVYNNSVVLGRHERVPDGITFDYTAATLRIKAECMGEIKVKIGSDKAQPQDYAVIVDGKRKPMRYALDFSSASELTLTFDIGKVFGVHEIEICRATERAYGSAVLKSFTLHGTLEKAEKREKLIEFLGDSITAGTACYRLPDNSGNTNYYHDGTMTYALSAAQELGFDYRMVAHAGYGFMISSAGAVGVGHTWDAEYRIQNYYRDETKPCDFGEQPDIVCIYLGTNDSNSAGKHDPPWGLTELTAGAKRMFEIVRECNPDAKIVWIIGGMTAGYGDAVRMAAAELGDEKNGFYTFRFDGSFHSAGMAHPSVAEHREMGRQLAEYLKTL